MLFIIGQVVDVIADGWTAGAEIAMRNRAWLLREQRRPCLSCVVLAVTGGSPAAVPGEPTPERQAELRPSASGRIAAPATA